MIPMAYRCGNLRILFGTAVRTRQRILSSSFTPAIQTFYSSKDRCFSSNQSKEDEDDRKDTPSVWQQLKSPPNIITLTRMASTPILSYWIVSEHYTLAIWGCTFAAISDALDGYIAKKYNMGTTVGTYLDPVSDKVLINGLAVSLWYSAILPTPLIVVWGLKDAGLLSGTAWMLYQSHNSINFFTTSLAEKPLQVEPTNIAKINTALQFATLGVGILSPVSTLSPMVLDSLCWITGATTVGSLLSYAGKSAIKAGTTTTRGGNDTSRKV